MLRQSTQNSWIVRVYFIEQLQSVFNMKTGIICAIAFVALVNGLDGIHAQPNRNAEIHDEGPYEDPHLCPPGAQKKDDCNNCFCPENGSGWACTRMLCRSDFIYPVSTSTQPNQDELLHRAVRQLDEPFSCVPNSNFIDDCNYCSCLPDGRSADCTLMACPPKDHS